LTALVAKFRKIANLIMNTERLHTEYLNYQKLHPIPLARVNEYSDPKRKYIVAVSNNQSSTSAALAEKRKSTELSADMNPKSSKPSKGNESILQLLYLGDSKDNDPIYEQEDVEEDVAPAQLPNPSSRDPDLEFNVEVISYLEDALHSTQARKLIQDVVSR
jgi:hypothetical protein